MGALAKTVVFGLISLLTFIAASFSSRSSRNKVVITVWWTAFIIGAIFHVISLFQGWKDSERLERLEFQEIAQYRETGNRSGSIGGIPMVKTPINNWSKKFMYRSNDILHFNCSDEAIAACDDVIKKVPKYPFSYYLRAVCKREISDVSWEDDAKTALSILKKTTALTDHHLDHDSALLDVKTMLERK